MQEPLFEEFIADDGFSPAATIGEIKVKGMQFSTQMICIKTLYNMIDRGDFYRITNKDLPVKRNKRPRKYKKVGKVAKNNKKGRSIEERPQVVNERKRFGDWEMDLVVGSGKTCLLVFTETLIKGLTPFNSVSLLFLNVQYNKVDSEHFRNNRF